jgi:epoxyqueuosine reductase
MNTGSGATLADIDFAALAGRIKAWGADLGFAKIGITGVALDEDEAHLLAWLREGRHGTMDYMQRHGTRRSRPGDLLPGTVRVISARMD